MATISESSIEDKIFWFEWNEYCKRNGMYEKVIFKFDHYTFWTKTTILDNIMKTLFQDDVGKMLRAFAYGNVEENGKYIICYLGKMYTDVSPQKLASRYYLSDYCKMVGEKK